MDALSPLSLKLPVALEYVKRKIMQTLSFRAPEQFPVGFHSAKPAPKDSSPEDALRFIALSFGESLFAKSVLNAISPAREARMNASHESEPRDDGRKCICSVPKCKDEEGEFMEISEAIQTICTTMKDKRKAFRSDLEVSLRSVSRAVLDAEPGVVMGEILELTPFLLEMKRRVLLDWDDSVATSDAQRLLKAWLEIVTACLTVLGRATDTDGAERLVEFFSNRVLELSLVADSVRTILLHQFRSDNCEMICAVLRLCIALKQTCDAASIKGKTAFLQSMASRCLGNGNMILSDCSHVSPLTCQFLSSFQRVESFIPFRFAQLLVSFFPRKTSEEDLCLLLSAVDPVPQSIKRDTLRFLARELGFKYFAMQSGKRERVKQEIFVETATNARVPKLQLPGFSQQLGSNEEAESAFPLKNFAKLREIFFLLAVSSIFQVNKLTLDVDLVDQFPLLSRKEPILFYIFQCARWLEYNQFAKEIGSIREKLVRLQKGPDILSQLMFNNREFNEDYISLGSGQFGTVHKTPGNTAIKLIRAPTTESDRCTIHDSLNEAICHSLCDQESFCVPLISCGKTNDGKYFFIETPLYTMDLSKWRASVPRDDPVSSVRLLIVFSQILSAVQFLHDDVGIVHYDLKMSNILVDFESADRLSIPKVGITDFGEARILHPDTERPCVRNRGTECIKSPEMLSIASSIKKDGPSFDRRKIVGTSTPSDIWSLGCLFFHLVTGECLFDNDETDWLQFYYRVTGEDPILNRRDRALLLHSQPFIEFVESLLVRDPSRRPDIKATIRKFQKLYVSTLQSLHGLRVELPSAIPGLLTVHHIHHS